MGEKYRMHNAVLCFCNGGGKTLDDIKAHRSHYHHFTCDARMKIKVSIWLKKLMLKTNIAF